MNAAIIIIETEQWRGGQAYRANMLPSISGETGGLSSIRTIYCVYHVYVG